MQILLVASRKLATFEYLREVVEEMCETSIHMVYVF